MRFDIKTPKQKFLGQFFQFSTTGLRDILPFIQRHALKCIMLLKVIKGGKNLSGEWIKYAFMQQIDFLVKKTI